MYVPSTRRNESVNHVGLVVSIASEVSVFTARRYTSAAYAVVMCLSVRPSVRHTPVLYQNDKERRTIAQGL